MTYQITGLDPAPFMPLYGLSDPVLAGWNTHRVIADSKPGFPCRITLEDAEPGERLLLLNHVSHDVETPYRSAYAIFVREGVSTPALFIDHTPPVFATRTLSLRAVDSRGMVFEASLVAPGQADAAIRQLLTNSETAYINVYNATAGCFSARVERK